MGIYAYKAIDDQATSKSGTIVGDSPAAARRILRESGLTVVSMQAIAQGGARQAGRRSFSNRSSSFLFGWGSAPNQFLGDLATLLSVGVTLVEGLETLIKQSKGGWANRLMELKESVESGLTFREAMARQPDVFDELSLSLVEMGENTGKLDESLRQLADFKRRSDEFKDRVFNALMYPAIILLMSIGVSLFLMNFVVPALLDNLADLGKELPWPTRVLKVCSDFLIGYGHFLLLVVGALGVVAVWFLRTATGKRLRDQTVLKVPVVGSMSRKQEISRVCFVVSTLLASGLDLIRSLEIARRTSKNVLLQESLGIIGERIRSGKELEDAMQQMNYFPPLVAQVFSVGQKSGRLDEMLLRLSEDYDKQVSTLSGRLAVIIEPLLIVVLSVVVGFILFATMLPILEAGNVL